MIKVFISQPMNGRSEADILEERNNAIGYVKDTVSEFTGNVEIIDSYFEDYSPDNGCIPLKYLSKSLELLADANILLCIGDWESARGCKIEHECARQYGINIIYYNEIAAKLLREKR